MDFEWSEAKRIAVLETAGSISSTPKHCLMAGRSTRSRRRASPKNGG
jgi:hypothetical protein